MSDEDDAPPLYPKIPREEFERMSFDEQVDYLTKIGVSGLKRYAGRPELLMKECRWRDFRNPPKVRSTQI